MTKTLGTLEIPDKNIKLDFENITLNQFKTIINEPSDCGMFIQRKPVGETIMMFTSNMPPPLYEKILEMIEDYCNH